MDPITTNTLNKNNVMTTRYFNNGTVYADFIKTSNGQLVDVKNTASEIELEDIRDDIQNINTELVDLNSKINELRGDVDLMSIDIQTDLFTPLYTSPNELTRMTALTSFITSITPVVDSIPKIKRFEGIINAVINTTDGAITTVNLRIRDIVYITKSNVVVPDAFLDCTIARLNVYRSNNTNSYRNIINNFYEMALNFGSDFQANYSNVITGFYFPERVYNINDGVWYELQSMGDRINTTPCDLSSYSRDKIRIHIPKMYEKLNNHRIFYKLFDSSTCSSYVTILIYKSMCQGYYTLYNDNFTYVAFYIDFNPRLLKSQDLKGNIYLCPKMGSVINWANVQSTDQPSTLSTINGPSASVFSISYLGTFQYYGSSFVMENNPERYNIIAMKD